MNDEQSRRAYWRHNLTYVGLLLCVWFVVSFGFGILLVEPLNRIELGGFQLGFWFAQQGAIYVFVLLILCYVVLMNRLDKRFGVDEADTDTDTDTDTNTNTNTNTNTDGAA